MLEIRIMSVKLCMPLMPGIPGIIGTPDTSGIPGLIGYPDKSGIPVR